MKDLLIVEDDPTLGEGIRLALQAPELRPQLCRSLADAGELLSRRSFDLLILDINLPDGNGLDFLRALRRESAVPVILLTANDLETDIVAGLELGADDYITKPFLPQELLLRLRSVLRRVYREAPDTVRLGDAEIDWGKGIVRRNGGETALTAKEFALLKKLWEARGNIVTIDALCDTLWDGPLVGYENTLMVHIRRLREKIEADPSHPKHLLTVRGLGYRLVREAAP